MADQAEKPVNGHPRVNYDAEVRYTASGKPIPKGLTPWRKGQSGNPGGRPRDYVGPTLAYKRVSQRTWKELQNIAVGKFPVGWSYGTQSAYCRAAQETVSAGKRGHPVEINARLEGPITQSLDLNLAEGGPLAMLALLRPPAAAQRIDEPAIDTPALPPDESDAL